MYGITGPRSEWFTISGVTFAGFDWTEGTGAALGECTHCGWRWVGDSGARTILTKGLQFVGVQRRIRHSWPYNGIFQDADSTLLDSGVNSFTTTNYAHLQGIPGCTKGGVESGYGIICTSQTPLRRIAIHAPQPSTLPGQRLQILRYDDQLLREAENDHVKEDPVTWTDYQHIGYRGGPDPRSSWTVAYVPGHAYRIHFGLNSGIDFTRLDFEMSEHWAFPNTEAEAAPRQVMFIHNFTDARAQFEV